ncbi:hypothetical protein ACN42_g5884 [Penicillium freii]|uniref:Uncharacterized protein n=1 Tax=Penicillium freii TaxID=48697 RepID=A0A101MIM0_PENFR|nr:hypothetical protein ACN42_g5884 [Penicillium freii]
MLGTMEGATTESRQIQGVGRDGSVGKCSKAETEADRGAALTLWLVNVFHMRAGHTSEPATSKHIVNAINYNMISQQPCFYFSSLFVDSRR